MKRDYLSIVVPVFNEEANLPELRRRLKVVVESLGFEKAEVLLVDDGSSDSSESIIRAIVCEDTLFTGIFLTRNFGHQAAVSMGLGEARGSIIAIIDGDLQDPPEVIARLIEAIEDGADVAYGVRKARKEGIFKRTAYATFYRLLQAVADIDIPLDTGDFACMTRRVLDAMLALPERNRFLRGLRAWVGYRQVGVEYECAARFAGQPKYTLRKLFGLAYDGLFSFSSRPDPDHADPWLRRLVDCNPGSRWVRVLVSPRLVFRRRQPLSVGLRHVGGLDLVPGRRATPFPGARRGIRG